MNFSVETRTTHMQSKVEWMRPSTCALHSLEPQVNESCSIKIAAHCTWPTMLRVRLTNELFPLQLGVQADHSDLQPPIVGQVTPRVQQLQRQMAIPLTELCIGATWKWSNENHFVINRHSGISIENADCDCALRASVQLDYRPLFIPKRERFAILVSSDDGVCV